MVWQETDLMKKKSRLQGSNGASWRASVLVFFTPFWKQSYNPRWRKQRFFFCQTVKVHTGGQPVWKQAKVDHMLPTWTKQNDSVSNIKLKGRPPTINGSLLNQPCLPKLIYPVWGDFIKSWGVLGADSGDTVMGDYTVGGCGGHWDGGIDKHVVGTTNVASFMQINCAAASQTMALFLQPDTLLQTYLCV